MSIIINDVDEAEAVALILQELSASRKAHPVYPADPLRRVAIMCEEAGEALKDALDMTRPGADPWTYITHQNALFIETIQTGAMAVKLLVAMIQERNNPPKREKILS